MEEREDQHAINFLAAKEDFKKKAEVAYKEFVAENVERIDRQSRDASERISGLQDQLRVLNARQR